MDETNLDLSGQETARGVGATVGYRDGSIADRLWECSWEIIVSFHLIWQVYGDT